MKDWGEMDERGLKYVEGLVMLILIFVNGIDKGLLVKIKVVEEELKYCKVKI